MRYTIDPAKHRIELAGAWAGFGFQNGHFWTPEHGDFTPADFAWPALQRNIVREWQALMAAERGHRIVAPKDTAHLAEILAGARARVLAERA
ncbi:MAG: hypothetical protein GX772_10240 [Alcaligenaceae bacterium]|nr:hypothetical protein [Alcaligenaceae bacterium]